MNYKNHPILLAHRGLHENNQYISSQEAFLKAIDNNLGIEIDIRNHENSLVVSHDLILKTPNLFFKDICEYAYLKNYTGYMAINVKEDNLEDLILPVLHKYQIKNWFTFDHSIPDLISSKNLNSFYRISEFENYIFKEDLNIKGCWLDSFQSPYWYDNDTLLGLLKKGDLAIVSSDLHGFPPTDQWGIIKEVIKKPLNKKVFLCTDLINEAINFFKLNEN